jgi:hypothetical protein
MIAKSKYIFTLICLLATLLFSECNFGNKPSFESPPVTVKVNNYSNSKLKETVEVWINDVLMIRTDTTEGEATYFFDSNELAIKVSTIDGRLLKKETVKMPRNASGLEIDVNYYNNFQSEDNVAKIVKQLAAKTLKYNNLPTDTIIPWLVDSLTSQHLAFAKSIEPGHKEGFEIRTYPLPFIYDCGTPFMDSE